MLLMEVCSPDMCQIQQRIDIGLKQKKTHDEVNILQNDSYYPLSKFHSPSVLYTSVGVSCTSAGVTEYTTSLSALPLLASCKSFIELFSSSDELVAEPETQGLHNEEKQHI